MARVRLTMVAILCMTGLVCAQDSTPSENHADHNTDSDRETIRLLIQQVKDLQERVKALEAERNPSAVVVPVAPAGGPPTPVQAAETAESHPEPAPPVTAQPSPLPSTPETSVSLHDLHGIQWRGFGEGDYKVLDQRQPETGTYGFVPGSAGNFYTGDFGLFLSSKLTERASVLSEIVFEEGDAQTYNVDLRRLLLNLDLGDHLKISFGRYQTAIGYYNWAFRSAAWLQTTADRPLVMEYASDGGILPTQAVGVSVTGSIPSGKLGLNYIAEYGSSDTVRPDINGDNLSNDENNGNHINLGFFLKPDWVPGLRIGGSFYHDQISDLVFVASSNGGVPAGGSGQGGEEPLSTDRWNQTIVNGHLVYVTRGIEFLNEGFLIRHAPIGGFTENFDSSAFYSQFSKKVGPVRPFFRYQYVNASPRNLIYNDIGLRWGPSFGARYDVNDYVAFKAQLDHTVRRGLPDLNGLHLQVAFTF